MKKIRRTIIAHVAAALALGSMLCPSARGQAVANDALPATSTEQTDAWRFRVSPYLWIPAQHGNVAVKGVQAPVDLSLGDTFDLIKDHFNFAFAMHAEATRGRWSLFGDVMYLNLQAEDLPPPPAGKVTVQQEQGLFELGAAYSLWERARENGKVGLRLETLAGARVYYLSMDIEPTLLPAVSGDQWWADGFVGLRGSSQLCEGRSVYARGDIGAGASDFVWNAEAGLDLRLNSWGSFNAGYRALSVDYSDGSGSELFKYDVTLHGPFIAFTVRF